MTDTTNTADADVPTRVSDEMRTAIGRTLSRRVSFPVSESDIRRWALAVHYPETPPERFIDAEAAAKSRYGGITAPEDFNPFAWLAAEQPTAPTDAEENDPNSVERTLGVTPPPLKFQLNGGMEVDYGVPMRPGDVITSENRLVSYAERPGRLGLMLFTVTEDTWTNQHGELVKRSRMTLIRY
ncbi:MaoC family dehydratase N-terminal domain-containing protein [Streptomyces sp. NPDC004237]|uniref:FAS1-like dehydratase domain-containing protein n=1 Tax=Streptomyces sp. NPDC004237 TaxID=3154455 RepID=UPI0033A5AE91